ncbi:diguanylate cyclase (GGDEF) domain-containing protein [Desulfosporosinus acidiphilus SJ4]|uniref:Diguanylate cyclase (GGDEF) domain-containing protein n=1 Tax=Desulfosporosinus acidiphilus (strain DSM 22704 / JCM 16185 / SJ4) TaxID=646529 RepID=I4D5T1_DESAJ|nr:diguanylate cyclase [Desulfosporosinus acidiphilus]AFM41155.1 diguanylate cyclase (GGDEF) domain-containing protein [Desulfosporosinus acidiphilus SJ4]
MSVQTQAYRLKPEDIFGLLQEINREENFEDALKILTKRGLDFFNSTMAGIWLFKENKFRSLTISARTEQQESFLKQRFFPFNFQIILKKVMEGNTAFEPKIEIHEIDETGDEYRPAELNASCSFSEWRENLQEFKIRRILCVPLVHYGCLFGLLVLFSADPFAFDENSIYWLEQLMPLISSNVYEQQLHLAALEREQALSLLLRGTEILVKAVSEKQLLAEAGEMAMEILYLEAGFFHMEQKGEWILGSSFGRLKQYETVWQEWINRYKECHFPTGYIPSSTPSLKDLEESDQWDIPYPVKKISIHPIITHHGIVGELWLMESGVRDLQYTQEILSAFVRMLSMSLETIRQRMELRRLATTDGLTGILNRQGFEQRILGEMANTLRRGTTFQFLLLDIDGFKNLNDTKGHPAGDLALIHLAHNLQKSVRLGDIVARTGGDEFAVILTDLKAGQDSIKIIERLKNNLELEKLGLGVTIGVAEFPTESKDYESLYKVSDRRLYIGKDNGKGQIVVSDMVSVR